MGDLGYSVKSENKADLELWLYLQSGGGGGRGKGERRETFALYVDQPSLGRGLLDSLAPPPLSVNKGSRETNPYRLWGTSVFRVAIQASFTPDVRALYDIHGRLSTNNYVTLFEYHWSP